jgi:carbon storage regulator CsrA
MLVLTRGRQEKVVFPSLGVEVVVLRIVGSRVQLGIKAPASMRVHRREVAERIDKEGSHEHPS